LTTASNAAFGVDSSDFTIEFWVNLNSTSGSQVFFDLRATQPSQAPCVYIAGNARFNYLWNSGSPVAFGPATLSTNTWYHVAIVRASGVHTGYVNGVSYSLSTTDSAGVSSSAISICGRQAVSPSDYLNGYLSNFRMVKGVAVYTTGFTPSTTPLTATQSANVNGNPSAAITGTQTSLLTCQSNRFKDNGTANGGLPFTITVNGTPQVNPYFYPSGFTAPAASPGAGLFNGTSQYLTAGTGTGLNPGAGNFTFECWIYATSTPTNLGIFQGNLNGFAIGFNPSSQLAVSQAGVAYLINDSTSFTLLNQWVHIVVARSGTTLSLYKNGARVATTAANSTAFVTSTQTYIASNGTVFFPGYVANLRLINGGTTVYDPTQTTITVPTSPVTATANTVLLLNLADSNYLSATNLVQNNTFIDSSNYAFPITRNGTPTQGSITPYWPNGQWSNYFVASSSQTLLTTETQVIPTGNFTIELFVYVTSSTATQAFVSQGTSGSAGRTAIGIDNSSGAKWFCQVGGVFVYSSAAPTLNTWNYLAMTYNSSTSTIALYLNGTQLNSASNTINAQNSQLRVGGLWTPATAGYYFDGYLSNVRVSNNVRTVTSIPTAPFTSDANTTLLTCQGNRFVDVSGTPKTLTPSGGPLVQAFQPFSPTASYTTALYGGSGYFNGTSDYVSAARQSAMLLGTNNFTIEFWVYFNSVAIAQTVAGSHITSAAGDWLIYTKSAGTLAYYLSSTGSTWNIANQVDIGTVVTGTWYHVALVRNGSVFTPYLNGVAGTTTTSSASLFASTSPVSIAASNNPSTYFSGYVSNFRMVNGTAVYTGAFTPPTLAPLATTGPASAASYSSTLNVNTTFLTPASLLLNMANAGIYDAAAQNDIITVGEVQTSTTPTPKFGVTTSIKFDPATNLDYLNILPVPPSLTLGTSNFTIEGWIYLNTVAGAQTIFDQRPAGTNGAYPCIYMNGATMVWYVNTAGQITSGALSTLTWYYFAITRSASVTRMYIDAVQVVSTYSDTNNYLASKTLIGVTSDIASGLNGNLQEFRITRGVARTITLPTAPFPTR
jgi:hypothetical protein